MMTQILEGVLIPLLIALTGYLIDYIRIKREELKGKIEDDLAYKYIDMIDRTITNCVIATNQTYVDSLKAQGEFGIEAQKQAFNDTLYAVKKILGEEVLDYISSITDDVNFYLAKKIEAKVNKNKADTY